ARAASPGLDAGRPGRRARQVGVRARRRLGGVPARPPLGAAARRGLRRLGLLLVLRLLREPAVEEALPLAPELVQGLALVDGRGRQHALGLLHAGPGLAHLLQELVVVREAEDGDARGRARVLVRQAEGLEREAARPVHVMADEVLLR